ncbi:unnamed protein product [Dovyalis caffra]|uniref:Sodium/calcium exchanger membrane region domain-containing protein n=1 Tax=Dovyalis caffra TaxID=77055 RepID=A0AAV1SD51_9ROSI|nr:unnamed protein product [Dovyalis caffra]
MHTLLTFCRCSARIADAAARLSCNLRLTDMASAYNESDEGRFGVFNTLGHKKYISLLAFGTSFPQISLATTDAIRNVGQLYAGGLGPGTLIGSAAFDLFPKHAVCVVVPKAGVLKKIADIGVWLVCTPNVISLWEALLTVLQYDLLLMHAYAQDKRWPYLSLPIPRTKRPEEWVPEEAPSPKHENNVYEDFSETRHGGMNAYVIAFTALASGTSWPDLVASKIAAERQTTADSAIANITCRLFLILKEIQGDLIGSRIKAGNGICYACGFVMLDVGVKLCLAFDTGGRTWRTKDLGLGSQERILTLQRSNAHVL